VALSSAAESLLDWLSVATVPAVVALVETMVMTDEVQCTVHFLPQCASFKASWKLLCEALWWWSLRDSINRSLVVRRMLLSSVRDTGQLQLSCSIVCGTTLQLVRAKGCELAPLFCNFGQFDKLTDPFCGAVVLKVRARALITPPWWSHTCIAVGCQVWCVRSPAQACAPHLQVGKCRRCRRRHQWQQARLACSRSTGH
jgi:hypothetical protein